MPQIEIKKNILRLGGIIILHVGHKLYFLKQK